MSSSTPSLEAELDAAEIAGEEQGRLIDESVEGIAIEAAGADFDPDLAAVQDAALGRAVRLEMDLIVHPEAVLAVAAVRAVVTVFLLPATTPNSVKPPSTTSMSALGRGGPGQKDAGARERGAASNSLCRITRSLQRLFKVVLSLEKVIGTLSKL